MVHHVSIQAKADLDRIWDYLYQESGSDEIADRQVDLITEAFCLLAKHPFAGRARDDDLGPGRRSFPVERYVIVYRIRGQDAVVLRVGHGSQDLKALMGG
ncbi:MAG: type II toxin-antitoxin system RelE/ParE family toxin [Beijerinckiaceae bacterium]